MSKHKKQNMVLDEDFFAQLDFLRADYDHAMESIEQQKTDIQRLISILVEKGIPIPGDIIDRYIKRTSETDTDSPEELPFN